MTIDLTLKEYQISVEKWIRIATHEPLIDTDGFTAYCTFCKVCNNITCVNNCGLHPKYCGELQPKSVYFKWEDAINNKDTQLAHQLALEMLEGIYKYGQKMGYETTT